MDVLYPRCTGLEVTVWHGSEEWAQLPPSPVVPSRMWWKRLVA